MSRRLALAGLGGFTAGSLAMAVGTYLIDGLSVVVAVHGVGGVVVGGYLAVALREESMLTFDDPEMAAYVRRYAPAVLGLLGILTLAVGLVTLAVALG